MLFEYYIYINNNYINVDFMINADKNTDFMFNKENFLFSLSQFKYKFHNIFNYYEKANFI